MTDSSSGGIDLHIHSTHSDGTLRPAELVARAAGLEVTCIALADHDAVSGISEALEAGARHGVNVIPAVELSVQYQSWSDVHLLGYGLNHTDPDFLDQLASFCERRRRRNEEILGRVNLRLARLGKLPIDLESVLAFAGGTVGRPHIARALIERGYAANIEQAFKEYLVPCNIAKRYWPIEDAISEIHRCGGVAVLAHPTTITRDRSTLTDIIVGLAARGLDGIEVHNNLATADESALLASLAGKRDLLATAGSDFHGIEEGIEIGSGRGIRFDGSLLPPLLERMLARTAMETHST